MLRHAALCLYLLVQCTTAIEWDELVDRVQDHHDTIGEYSSRIVFLRGLCHRVKMSIRITSQFSAM